MLCWDIWERQPRRRNRITLGSGFTDFTPVDSTVSGPVAKWKIVAGAPEGTKAFCLHAGKQRQMVRVQGLIVPTQNRFPTTRFLSQKLTLILGFHLHLVVPQTGGQAFNIQGFERQSRSHLAWSYSLNCLQSSLQQRSLSISTHSVCKKFKVGPRSCTQHLEVKKKE